MLLEDFGDYGHGAAGTVPSNFIDVGIAPFSYTYETLPANERMTWIMNHESIHIVMGDNANSVDRRFRSLFFGKVAPTDDDPVSILYSSLTSPRHYSTRWFHEGIATFMETWMAGGLGRAMGGCDEMVFPRHGPRRRLHLRCGRAGIRRDRPPTFRPVRIRISTERAS